MASENNLGSDAGTTSALTPDLLASGASFVSPPPLELDVGVLLRDLSMYRTKDITECLQMSRSTLYNLIKAQQFPQLVRNPFTARGGGASGGQYRQVVDAWLQSRMDLRSGMSRLREPVVMPIWTAEMLDREHRTGIRMLHMEQLEEMVGLKSTRIYDLIKQGRFPAPAPLTTAMRRWVWHEIEEWLRGRYAFSLRISGVRVRSAPSCSPCRRE